MTTTAEMEHSLLRHFEAYQRAGDALKARKKGSRGHRGNQGPDASSLEARVVRMKEEMESHFLNHGVSSVSEDDDDECDDPLLFSVTDTVLRCIDAAFAASISTDTTDKNGSNNEVSIHRILELAACFSCHTGNGQLAKAVLARSIQFSGVIMERVRALGCTMVGLCVQQVRAGSIQDDGTRKRLHLSEPLEFLENIPDTNDDYEWRVECVNMSRKALLPRLTDKSQAVRIAAISSCAFLYQGVAAEPDDEEEDGEILDALLWNMVHDPSVSNRIKAVHSVLLTDYTIPFVVERVRDVKVKVRVAALEVLHSGVSVKDLTSEQSAVLVRFGLTERCASTRQATTKMICAGWMKAVKYDPIALLALLQASLYTTECQKVAQVLLDVAEESDRSALEDLSGAEIRAFCKGVTDASVAIGNGTELSPEKVLFARVKCDRALASTKLTASRKADVVSAIVPDIPILCDTLLHHLNRLSQDMNQGDEEAESYDCFICTQLLQLAQVLDLAEEGSRRHVIATLTGALSSMSVEIPDDLLDGCVCALKVACGDEVELLVSVRDILSSIAPDNGGAATSAASLLRVMVILSTVLEHTSGRSATDPILAEFGRHIVPAITNCTTSVREIGVGCLGRLALLSDQETATEEFNPLLLQVASNANEKLEIRAQAMLAMSDLSFVFADVSLSGTQDATNDSASFQDLLSDMLDDSEPGVVSVASEIAAKLLFSGKMSDPSLVAKLILVFFCQSETGRQSDDEDDVNEVGSPTRMQQLLSVFFPAYALKSIETQSVLASSTGHILAFISEKLGSGSSKLKTWPVAKMMDYVSSIIDIGLSDKKKQGSVTEANDEHVQDSDQEEEDATLQFNERPASGALSVALEISKFVLKESEGLPSSYLRILCKILGSVQVDLDADGVGAVSELRNDVEELSMLISDGTCLRALETLATTLESHSVGNESNGSDDSLADHSERSLAE